MATQKEKVQKFPITSFPGQWKILLAVSGEKSGFLLTCSYKRKGEKPKKVKMFLCLSNFTTKTSGKSITYEFAGRLSNGMDARGTYDPKTNEGWIEYVDEEEEEKEAEEKLKKVLALGMQIGGLYMRGIAFGFNEKEMIIQRGNLDPEETRIYKILSKIRTELEILNIPYSTKKSSENCPEDDQIFIPLALSSSDRSILFI